MPTVAALPYDYSFDPSRLGLVVIDMQRDFLEPGGFGETLGNDVSLLAAAVPAVEKLLRVFRDRSLTIIHTKECHRPDLSDCPPSKRNRGSCTLRIGDAGPMGRILIDGEPGITHLLVTGVTTEVCVQTTMREANDRGYECLLVEDATESYFPEFKKATLEMVRAQSGIVGWTATTAQVLAGLGA